MKRSGYHITCFWGLNRLIIYQAFCLHAAHNRMNGAQKETQTPSCGFASLAHYYNTRVDQVIYKVFFFA